MELWNLFADRDKARLENEVIGAARDYVHKVVATGRERAALQEKQRLFLAVQIYDEAKQAEDDNA
jgi:hypothetical protein